MDNYNFEEFNSVGSRFNIVITLGKAERFYFGNSMCRKYNIFSLVGMKLLFDKGKNAVGFRFLTENEDGMVNIKKLDDKSAYINAKAFLGMYDIDANKFAGRYHPTEITDKNGKKMFVIELKEKTKN